MKVECNECNNKGYVHTYNTQKCVDEIQRCDDCMTFKDDQQASLIMTFYILNDNKWVPYNGNLTKYNGRVDLYDDNLNFYGIGVYTLTS